MSSLISSLIIILLIFISLEIVHKSKPYSPLTLNYKKWRTDITSKNIKISGLLIIYNPHKSMEIMITDLKIKAILLGNKYTDKIITNIKIKPELKDLENREDNYWTACIIKSRKIININVEIILENTKNTKINSILESLWINIIWDNYGPFGNIHRQDGFVVPIYHPSKLVDNLTWNFLSDGTKLMPIKTHILGRLDDPLNIIYNYSSSIIKKGDILTIGETPLAIMQGRYLSPNSIKVTWLAKLLCRSFHPTSSLATACGMQSLINIIGPSRTIFSWIIGALLKIFRIKGIFYILAGKQACLIDDITGTTPPYDKNIVLGPININKFCHESSKKLGIDIAVVDVNDLGKVKILASSNNCYNNFVKKVLSSNPAGNANQHTPLVLIRPS